MRFASVKCRFTQLREEKARGKKVVPQCGKGVIFFSPPLRLKCFAKKKKNSKPVTWDSSLFVFPEKS